MGEPAATTRDHLLNLQASLQELVDNCFLSGSLTVMCSRALQDSETLIEIKGRGRSVFVRDDMDLGKALAWALKTAGHDVDIDEGLTWEAWVAGDVSLGTRWPNAGQVMKRETALCELEELPDTFAMATVGALPMRHDAQIDTRRESNLQTESTMSCETEAEDEDHKEPTPEPTPEPTHKAHDAVEGFGIKVKFPLQPERGPMLSREIIRGDSGVPDEERFSVPMDDSTVRQVLVVSVISAAVAATALFGTIGAVVYALAK